MATAETAVEVSPIEVLEQTLAACPHRGMFTFQQVADVVWTLAVYPESVSKIGGDFLNAHRDEAHIGGMSVGDMILDVLIAIDKHEERPELTDDEKAERDDAEAERQREAREADDEARWDNWERKL